MLESCNIFIIVKVNNKHNYKERLELNYGRFIRLKYRRILMAWEPSPGYCTGKAGYRTIDNMIQFFISV